MVDVSSNSQESLTDIFQIIADSQNRSESFSLLGFLPVIKLDKYFDMVTIEHYIAPKETSSFYQTSLKYFYNQIDENLRKTVLKRDLKDKSREEIAEIINEALCSLSPEDVIAPLSEKLTMSLTKAQDEIVKEDVLKNFSSECENIQEGFLAGRALKGQWDLIYKHHKELRSDIKKWGNGKTPRQISSSHLSPIRRLIQNVCNPGVR
jgi:hypothetical protein